MSERVPVGGPYRAAVGLHDSLNLQHIRDVKRIISIYCSGPRDYCCELLQRLVETGLLVARARLEDLVWDEEYKGLDAGLFKLYSRLVEFYAWYISGVIASYNEDPLVKITGVVQVDNVVLQPGEYARLPLSVAAALYLAGLAEPVRATAIKASGACIGEGEEERQ